MSNSTNKNAFFDDFNRVREELYGEVTTSAYISWLDRNLSEPGNQLKFDDYIASDLLTSTSTEAKYQKLLPKFVEYLGYLAKIQNVLKTRSDMGQKRATNVSLNKDFAYLFDLHGKLINVDCINSYDNFYLLTNVSGTDKDTKYPYNVISLTLEKFSSYVLKEIIVYNESYIHDIKKGNINTAFMKLMSDTMRVTTIANKEIVKLSGHTLIESWVEQGAKQIFLYASQENLDYTMQKDKDKYYYRHTQTPIIDYNEDGTIKLIHVGYIRQKDIPNFLKTYAKPLKLIDDKKEAT